MKTFSRLLYVSSGLWLIVAGCMGHRTGDETAALLAVIVLPVLVGLLVARYPWVKAPATPSLRHKAVFGLLVTVSALWLTYSAVLLSLFFAVGLLTGWD